MSGLKKYGPDSFVMDSDCEIVDIEIDKVYLSIKKINEQLVISTHPLGDGVDDNCLGRIRVSLSGNELVVVNKDINSYPTLK